MKTGAEPRWMQLHAHLPLIESCLLAGLCTLFLVRGLLPGWQSLRTDFGNYYVVARLLSEHYAVERIYDWIWLQRIKDHWSIQQSFAAFVGLTPFSALPMVPIAWMDALEAKRIWLLANLCILAASLFGMEKVTGLGLQRATLIAFLAIIPLRNNFLFGQMHVVVLGLLVLAYWLYIQGRWLSCGLALGIAASLKVYPIFFVLYFMRKREWKPAAALAGSTAILLAACFPIFGAPVMRTFLTEQFPRMLRGEATDSFSLTAPSASSLFHRIFIPQPLTNPHPLFAAPALFAALYPLWQLGLTAATLILISSREVEPQRRRIEWAAWTCLLLALSTEPASYHRVVLIFVAILGMSAIQGARLKAFFFACYLIACNLHPNVSAEQLLRAVLFDFLPFWALVATLVCLLIDLRSKPVRMPNGIPSRIAWTPLKVGSAVACFALIWCAVSASTLLHVKALNGSAFIVDRSSTAYARFAPHRLGAHVLSVALLLEGYRVVDEEGRRFRTNIGGANEDQLTVATSSNSDLMWIEAAKDGHSRLVELHATSEDTTGTPVATIQDAESPVLSPDGTRLGFLKEDKGIGSAWVVHLDQKGQVIASPKPISPAGMNVWSIAFATPDGFLISAADRGVPHLFVARAGTAPMHLLSSAEAMDSPALDPQSSILLHQELRGGYWRLVASDASHGEVTQLTFGDCNAYDPAWLDASRVLYISDCGRGMHLGALAELPLAPIRGTSARSVESALPASKPHGESKQ